MTNEPVLYPYGTVAPTIISLMAQAEDEMIAQNTLHDSTYYMFLSHFFSAYSYLIMMTRGKFELNAVPINHDKDSKITLIDGGMERKYTTTIRNEDKRLIFVPIAEFVDDCIIKMEKDRKANNQEYVPQWREFDYTLINEVLSTN